MVAALKYPSRMTEQFYEQQMRRAGARNQRRPAAFSPPLT